MRTVLRTGSDFDRPYTGQEALNNLINTPVDGLTLSIANIYNAGIEVVNGILKNWKMEFSRGIPSPNYVGDIFGTLGGERDFGYDLWFSAAAMKLTLS